MNRFINTYASNEDLKQLGDKLDKQFSNLDANLEMQVSRIADSQNDLKVSLKVAIGEIQTIKEEVTKKASTEAHNALMVRVAKMEDNPNSIKGWINIAIAGGGCLLSTLIGMAAVVLTFTYFIVNNIIK